MLKMRKAIRLFLITAAISVFSVVLLSHTQKVHNDGYGWGGSNPNQHDQLSDLAGTPETPATFPARMFPAF